MQLCICRVAYAEVTQTLHQGVKSLFTEVKTRQNYSKFELWGQAVVCRRGRVDPRARRSVGRWDTPEKGAKQAKLLYN